MYIEVNNNKKWKRSSRGWLGGVCEGLGHSFNIDPSLMRIIWALSIFAFGTGLLAYVVLWFALPKEDELMDYHGDKLLGVCKRISEQTSMELALVRVLAIVSAIASLGTTTLIYIILYFVLPVNRTKIHM